MLAPVIAIVDVQRILQESLAAKSVQQQLEAQRAKFQTEIVAEEKDLRQAEQELSKSRDNLKPDVFAEREQQLRQRFLTVERHVQSRRKALDQAYTNSMNVVRKSLQDVVGAVAKEYGANLVIIKQQTLWSDKQMDITDKALARLNNDLSRVEVKVLPEEEAKTGEKKAAPPR
ncbi:MAG: OmpH family outer membrane protein [Alphaproteobacteria bacterium]|nr:OmpH family outer membrane protein [Alphaproteobacteria bacterium]